MLNIVRCWLRIHIGHLWRRTLNVQRVWHFHYTRHQIDKLNEYMMNTKKKFPSTALVSENSVVFVCEFKTWVLSFSLPRGHFHVFTIWWIKGTVVYWWKNTKLQQNLPSKYFTKLQTIADVTTFWNCEQFSSIYFL